MHKYSIRNNVFRKLTIKIQQRSGCAAERNKVLVLRAPSARSHNHEKPEENKIINIVIRQKLSNNLKINATVDISLKT